MALTRKSLKAMGLTDEQVESIIDLHTEVTDALKTERDEVKSQVEKLKGVEKELNDLKAKADDGYKEKYEKEHQDFENYKKEVTAKESKAAKENAAKAYFEGKNITGANLEIALRGARDEINDLEIADGKIKDTTALDALVTGTFAGLVVSTKTTGAKTATPPTSTNGSRLTRADIYKTDEHGRYIMSTEERQKALAENPELLR